MPRRERDEHAEAIVGILSHAVVAKLPSFKTARLMKSVARKTRRQMTV